MRSKYSSRKAPLRRLLSKRTGAGLFVAADLPPIQAFEFGHFFGAVFLIPAAPGEGVRGKIFVRDFLQREESPVSHLSGCPGIHRQINELGHHGHALFTREDSAVGNIAACAIPHAVGGIFGERSEKLVENFIFAQKAHPFDSPLPHHGVLIVSGIIQEHAVNAIVVDTTAREHTEIVDGPGAVARVRLRALDQQIGRVLILLPAFQRTSERAALTNEGRRGAGELRA